MHSRQIETAIIDFIGNKLRTWMETTRYLPSKGMVSLLN